MDEQTIAATLLSRLLVRPRGLDLRSYRAASDILFPCPEDVKTFLGTRDAEKRTEAARKVILSLIHTHRLCPPTHLLINLLDIEAKDEAKAVPTTHGYVAKGHFVHLVNLYLLGIYLYSYHVGIHVHCKQHLNRIRHAALASETVSGASAAALRAVTEYELFAELWTYFILAHDIAYPLESVSPEQRRGEMEAGSLRVFGTIGDRLLHDLALKALANLLTIEVFVRGDAATTLADYLNGSCELGVVGLAGDLPANLLADLGDAGPGDAIDGAAVTRLLGRFRCAVHLPRFRGPFALRLLSSFLPSESIYAVLESKMTGQPGMLLVRSAAGALVLAISSLDGLPRSLRRVSVRELVDCAFVHGKAPCQGVEWQYFVEKAAEHTSAFVEKALGKSKTDYETLLAEIESVVPFTFRELGSESGPIATAVHAFLELQDRLASQLPGELSNGIDAAYKRTKAAATRTAKGIEEIIADTCAQQFRALERQGKVDPYALLIDTDPAVRLSELRKLLARAARPLAEAIDRKIGASIREGVALETSATRVLGSVRKRLETTLPKTGDATMNPFSGCTIGPGESLAALPVDRCKTTLALVEKVILRSGLYRLDDLLENYEPPFAEDPGAKREGTRLLDHGLGAAIAYASCGELYRAVFQVLLKHSEPEAPEGVRLLRLAMLLSSPADDGAAAALCDHTLPEAAGAVAMHNLAPDCLAPDRRDYKTSLRTNPFAYLCMAADGLQMWDRGVILNQALARLPHTMTGDDVDIDVQAEELRVRIRVGHGRARRAAEEYREKLATYLKNADSLISLDIRETRR